MSKIEILVKNLKKVSVPRLFSPVFALVLSIPIFKLLYWNIDSSYLAEFGIGPEFYTREAFSSDLITAWFIGKSIEPILWLWISACVLLFFVLFFIERKKNKRQSLEERIPDEGVCAAEPLSNNEIESIKIKKSLTLDAVGKSAAIPYYLFVFGIVLILLLASLLTYYVGNGKELASIQINGFVNHNQCYDRFNNDVVGCYKLDERFDESEDVLLIFSNEEHIGYMSREENYHEDLDSSVLSAPTYNFYVKVVNKKTGERLTRTYVVAGKNVDTQEVKKSEKDNQ